MRFHFGLFQNERTVQIVDMPAFFRNQLYHFGQQFGAVHVFPSGVVVGEIGADVFKAGGTQQSITHSVEQHIAIGMGGQS